jgi:hypothetical protein
MTRTPWRQRWRAIAVQGGLLIGLVLLGGCGGGTGNPLDNPPQVNNPAGATGQSLSYAYFQRCINPIFLTPLQINLNGVVSTNTCAGAGCHNNATGTGGAFRVIPSAQVVDVTNPSNTPDVIRATDMYKNFYSAQGEVVIGSPLQSRLVDKPLLLGVLHGGGLVFANQQDPNVRFFEYWISHPVPSGQDEFSTANYSMFTPADPVAGACNTN